MAEAYGEILLPLTSTFQRVSCRKCNENPKTQKQYFESSRKSDTSGEKAEHSLLAAREPCRPTEPARFPVKFGGS